MPAHIWLILGILTMALEVLAPSGFFLFILGTSGLIVGLLVTAGFLSNWWIEVSVFCALSVVVWVLLGKRLRGLLGAPGPQAGQLVGSIVVVGEEIAPGKHGSGELWGTQWRLENVDAVTLTAGSEAVVVAGQGVSLQVKKK